MPSLNMSMHEALELLRRQYFQLLPLERLSLPSDDILKDATFQASLVHKLFRADDPSPLDPERYKLRVLKGIVSRLESAMSDPEEDVRSPCPLPALSYSAIAIINIHSINSDPTASLGHI